MMRIGTMSMITLALLQVSSAYAASFHTIIGPDGRPMVVQRTEPKKSVQVKNTSENKVSSNTINAIETEKKEVVPVVINSVDPLQLNVHDDSSKVVHTSDIKVQTEHLPKKKILKQTKTVNIEQKPTVRNAQNTGFEEFDTVEYVSNEYLENKEFNLEGRKRFYTMPEGVIDNKGSGVRLQTIEREKGVGQSAMKSLFKKSSVKDDGPIILASTYYRVSQDDAIDGLGQACFNNKKLKKSKILSKDNQVNLWPRAPIKNEFDYELVKVEDSVQNIRINSYASREKDPTFYWPFVVFLDEKACVIEGAGGYKNQETHANVIQHINIEGVIHVPKDSHYILMTPLATAIDVDQHGLTNQGQLKLSVIR